MKVLNSYENEIIETTVKDGTVANGERFGIMRERRWFSGVLVAGLMMSAIVSGGRGDVSGSQEAYKNQGMYESVRGEAGTLPMQKRDFHVTEYVAEGIAVLQQELVTQIPGNGGVVEGSEAMGTSAPTVSSEAPDASVSAASNAPAAVSDGSSSAGRTGVITAGSGNVGSPGMGPSAYENLVTEGEKGAPPQESILGGATLTMLNSQSNSQMLSVILQTSQGKLIVVDGGLGVDGDYLRSQLQARGGHVAAWLITHPHGDHVGALYQILQDERAGIPSRLTIDGIYYSFGVPEWYTLHDPGEQTMAHSIIGTFEDLPQSMLRPVSRGQVIQVDDVTVQVMNDRYELSEDKGNNAGIVYKATVNGKTILFLGDMAEAGGNRLLAECGAEALKSDIVQMAHHGQGGVSEEVYKAVNPDICLWPTPQWLWDNIGARYKTPVTKTWMSKLNVQKHYCMKDGDQTIR